MMSSSAAEAYRGLRSTVKFTDGEYPVRSVLVVDIDRSTLSGVARNLAETFVRAGDSCVYVDTDVRRAQADHPGFIDLVAGRTPMDTISRTDEQSTNLVTIGPGTLDDPDLLISPGLDEALRSLRESFSFQVLSSASLPEHSDAIALAPNIDATILVVTAGQTHRGKAIEARDALARVGARLLGVVLVERTRRWF